MHGRLGVVPGAILLLGLLLAAPSLLAPLAAAHEGEHGLHVTDVHFTYRVPSLQQEVRFVVHNDEDGGWTQGLTAEASYAYTFVRDVFPLPELAPGTARHVILRVPDQFSAYGCVQAFAIDETSDASCASTSGAGVG